MERLRKLNKATEFEARLSVNHYKRAQIAPTTPEAVTGAPSTAESRTTPSPLAATALLRRRKRATLGSRSTPPTEPIGPTPQSTAL